MFSLAWPIRYLKWHYTDALYDLFVICRDLAFFWFYFWGSLYFVETLGELLWLPENDSLLADGLSRLVGVALRFVFVSVGFVGLVVMLPISLLVIAGWLLYPWFILVLILMGADFLFYA